jgi:hypothetical protein
MAWAQQRHDAPLPFELCEHQHHCGRFHYEQWGQIEFLELRFHLGRPRRPGLRRLFDGPRQKQHLEVRVLQWHLQWCRVGRPSWARRTRRLYCLRPAVRRRQFRSRAGSGPARDRQPRPLAEPPGPPSLAARRAPALPASSRASALSFALTGMAGCFPGNLESPALRRSVSISSFAHVDLRFRLPAAGLRADNAGGSRALRADYSSGCPPLRFEASGGSRALRADYEVF